jgi:hypothetical protein
MRREQQEGKLVLVKAGHHCELREWRRLIGGARSPLCHEMAACTPSLCDQLSLIAVRGNGLRDRRD